jgi:hypothetical protein
VAAGFERALAHNSRKSPASVLIELGLSISKSGLEWRSLKILQVSCWPPFFPDLVRARVRTR